MKPAVIFSIPMTTSNGYCWRWRSVDSKADSKKQFAYYYECFSDATTNGYTVQIAVAQGNTAPGWASLTAHATPQG